MEGEKRRREMEGRRTKLTVHTTSKIVRSGMPEIHENTVQLADKG